VKTMKLAGGAAAALVLAALVSPGTAHAVTPSRVQVSFTSDTAGNKLNGYSSPDSASMLFFDTLGSNLRVDDFGVQSHGQALAVVAGGSNALEIKLTNPTTAISMAFGNDDPGLANATDQAQLTAFRGATEVGQVSVNFNANDVMDQSIRFGDGPLFNRVILQYVSAANVPIAVAEVVDDISVNPLCTIAGNAGDNVLIGTPGNDVICGDSGDDRISGGGGNDLIYPGLGNDSSNGGGGNDTILDSLGNDVIDGGAGSDDVRGARGNDDVRGGTGADQVIGGPGQDRLNGGANHDRCDGGPDHDTAQRCEVKIHIP
jgi:Ca2+-binding RTX toxin-like protein